MAPFCKSPRPPPPPPRVILVSKSRTCGSHLPSNTCKMCGNGSRRGGGMAWVAFWRAFLNTEKCSFLMISPKLLYISPFFLLIFSPLGTADFLVLLALPGDGYSLLCSKKQPPRHTSIDFVSLLNSKGFCRKTRKFIIFFPNIKKC
jgi:hypothetical protein